MRGSDKCRPIRGRCSSREFFSCDPTTWCRSSNVSAPKHDPVKGRRSPPSGWSISGDSPRIVEADGREANTRRTGRSLPIPAVHLNRMRFCWRKEHPSFLTFVPAARTSLLLVEPLLLIARSCRPYQDLACLPFACSRHPALSCHLPLFEDRLTRLPKRQ